MAIESVHRAQLIAYEWLIRDAMDAASRMAHFLCEHALRSKGRHTDSLEMPITQAQMGHVTAQTSVNVNRVLRLLEKDGLLMPIGERRFRADWDELRRLGRFDPAYLDRR